MRTRRDSLVLGIVTLVVLCLAVQTYLHYLSIERFRWADPCQDRNTHYLLALKLGRALRHLNPLEFLRELERQRTWPPLHGVLASLPLAVGGLHRQLGVLPNLAAWCGTVVLAFLTARRAAPSRGYLAGLLAALYVIYSPAHRVYATDYMLESLGAFLTLLVLHTYMSALEHPTVLSWRRAALVLTLLFFMKYNYWLLSALALAAADFLPNAREYSRRLLQSIRIQGRDWTSRLIRNPVGYAVLLASIFPVYVLVTGGGTYHLMGIRIDASVSADLFYPAYLVCFAAAVIWWIRRGRALCRAAGPKIDQFAVCHFWPIAIWMAIPRRLGYFLYFVSPLNGGKPIANVATGPQSYWSFLRDDYHWSPWAMWIMLALVGIAVLFWRKSRPIAAAPVTFLFVQTAFTLLHPYHQSRFLCSWIALAWVSAGVGFAWLLDNLPRGAGRAGTWIGGSALAALAFAQYPAVFMQGHSPEPGHFDLRTSTLDVTDEYLPWVAKAKSPAFFATIPMKNMFEWTWIQAFPDRLAPEMFIRKFGVSAEANRDRFDAWIGSTAADRLIFVDFTRESTFYREGYNHYQQYRELIHTQSRFRQVHQRQFPEFGCTLSVWSRVEYSETSQ